METMVARCSSDRLSVGVVPGAELQPGNTSGAEKSAANHTAQETRRHRIDQSGQRRVCGVEQRWPAIEEAVRITTMPTWVVHVAHDPVHGGVDASVAGVVHSLPAGLQGEAHLT